MAAAPRNDRLTVEEFKSQASWISKLLYTLNYLTQTLNYALTNRLSIHDNLAQELKVIDFVYESSGLLPIQFRCKLNDRAVGLWVVNCVEVAASPAIVAGPIYCAWSWNGGVVSINSIANLTAGTKYELTVVVSYG